jgi:hypothetical protein
MTRQVGIFLVAQGSRLSLVLASNELPQKFRTTGTVAAGVL